ncbi:hypoxanthine phosphoribosyltransferase [Saccharospirillum sp. MSK14-1]|uniref:phosphoribosyltransferase n=1 Tax=Saccharospirillum sp. MSK14-1 TaxID=1897632 RepID=UPI000D35B433|nr:phosphoribosyltransferase family protein [Saccharospirillum sp. MSK14-1]PTY36039.1 hypoxanthine phosphoribosyltransferase [Saccharospirillum sp. MSK14-1]
MMHPDHDRPKRYLDEAELIRDAFRLGVQIYESGFRPNFIVGLWRGGSTVGIYVQECLQTLGVNTDHTSLRTSYQGMTRYADMVAAPQSRIRVHGTQYLLENLNADDRLLIVDDAFGTGHSLAAVLERLNRHLKRNMPSDTRLATLYERPSANQTGVRPDYSLHQSEDWLVFPYEMNGLSRDEIDREKPYLTDILNSVS